MGRRASRALQDQWIIKKPFLASKRLSQKSGLIKTTLYQTGPMKGNRHHHIHLRSYLGSFGPQPTGKEGHEGQVSSMLETGDQRATDIIISKHRQCHLKRRLLCDAPTTQKGRHLPVLQIPLKRLNREGEPTRSTGPIPQKSQLRKTVSTHPPFHQNGATHPALIGQKNLKTFSYETGKEIAHL